MTTEDSVQYHTIEHGQKFNLLSICLLVVGQSVKHVPGTNGLPRPWLDTVTQTSFCGQSEHFVLSLILNQQTKFKNRINVPGDDEDPSIQGLWHMLAQCYDSGSSNMLPPSRGGSRDGKQRCHDNQQFPHTHTHTIFSVIFNLRKCITITILSNPLPAHQAGPGLLGDKEISLALSIGHNLKLGLVLS